MRSVETKLSRSPRIGKGGHDDRRARRVSLWVVLFFLLSQGWISAGGAQNPASPPDKYGAIDGGFFVARKDLENIQDPVFKEGLRRFLEDRGILTKSTRGLIYYFIAEEQIEQISDVELKGKVKGFVAASLEEPSPGTESEIYEIRPGDTLWEVAKSHGMSMGELLYLNELPPDQPIYPGQKLRVHPK